MPVFYDGYIQNNNDNPSLPVSLLNVDHVHGVGEPHLGVCLRQSDQGLKLTRVRSNLYAVHFLSKIIYIVII